MLADHVPEFDATAVTRLTAAGAVLLGKLNLTEGAMGGYHPEFPIPRNPWDSGRWAGASSSGSGVATAAGPCFGSLGTDTGGSIRFPAACNGTVVSSPPGAESAAWRRLRSGHRVGQHASGHLSAVADASVVAGVLVAIFADVLAPLSVPRGASSRV